MKKTWIVYFIIVFTLVIYQQSRFVWANPHGYSPSSIEDGDVPTDTPPPPIDTPIDTPIPTNTPHPTHTPTPTRTPTPTPTPTNTPTPTPTPTPPRDILNNRGFTTGTAQKGETVISLSSFLPIVVTPTRALLPTYTPIPPRSAFIPTSTLAPATNLNTVPTTAPYIYPTTPLTLPTPLPLPTEQRLPSNLTKQTDTSKTKTTIVLDTKKLTEIKIAPNTTSPNAVPTERPFIPQEQRLLAKTEPQPVLGGILVTLAQKAGEALVTRQDELTVKRGNQFFTISNEVVASEPHSQQALSNKSSVVSSQTKTISTPAPQLEINANNVIAKSSMGLSVDPLSGILTVDTPSGPQKVTIMPDEALGIVVELKALNTKGVVEPSILLVSEQGALIYRVSGERVEKLLGLFPLAIQKQILISADTGSVIKVELSLVAQVLSLLTF